VLYIVKNGIKFCEHLATQLPYVKRRFKMESVIVRVIYVMSHREAGGPRNRSW